MIKLKISSIVVISIFLLSSCGDEFFELENPPQFPWQKPEDLELGISSAYNRTFLSDWGNPVGNNFLAFEAMSDHVYLLPGTSGDIPFNELYFRQFETPLDDAGSFSQSYQAIGNCNNAIDFYKVNDMKPFPESTDAQRLSMDRLLGELYFIRAFNYWHLALRYLPKPGSSNFETAELIPMRINFPTDAQEAASPPYMTGAMAFDLILSDLKKAYDLLPERYRSGIDNASYEYGRANKFTAAALMSKVYFFLGSPTNAVYYDSALTHLDYVIDQGSYSLDQDPIEAWNKSDQTAGNEVIWYALYYDLDKNATFKRPTSMNYSDYRATGGNRGTDQRRCPWNQFTLAHSTLKEIGWFDDSLNSTENALKDKRYQQLYYRLEGNRGEEKLPNGEKKYPNDDPLIYETLYPQIKEAQLWGDKYYRAPVGPQSNVPVMRVAEMYLTRAILRLKYGSNPSGALSDLNTVRVRAGLEELQLSELTEEAIHNERVKELAFEMDRMVYLMSLKMPIGLGDREQGDVLNPPYENVYWIVPQEESDFKNNN